MGIGPGDRRRGQARAPAETAETSSARSQTRGVRASIRELTQPAARRKRRVLVVEDDGPIRALIAEICRQQGHDALEAATGANAIELGRAAQPDLARDDSEEIPLTMRECTRSAALAANPERALTRAQLRHTVWGYPHHQDDHSVERRGQRLRRKRSKSPDYGVILDAVSGRGCRLGVR